MSLTKKIGDRNVSFTGRASEGMPCTWRSKRRPRVYDGTGLGNVTVFEKLMRSTWHENRLEQDAKLGCPRIPCKGFRDSATRLPYETRKQGVGLPKKTYNLFSGFLEFGAFSLKVKTKFFAGVLRRGILRPQKHCDHGKHFLADLWVTQNRTYSPLIDALAVNIAAEQRQSSEGSWIGMAKPVFTRSITTIVLKPLMSGFS
jgi:hypothetical protein